MAKKAKKVSWRTLARRADNLADKGKLKEAAAARKLSAAERRADRAAKGTKKKTAPPARRNLSGAKRAVIGWATRRANEIKKAGASIVTETSGVSAQGISRGQEAWQAEAHHRGAPGHGEVVGGAYAELAERIAKLVRKKGGMNGVYNELATLAASSKYEGHVESDTAATKRLIEVQQAIADRVVCGFIAEIDACTAQHRGLPPAMTFNISAFLTVKIIDALNNAGYRATGKT